MDIFEGTEQTQQLVIGRAISGLCIELLAPPDRPKRRR
jgi:hypothetical protein